MAEFRPIAEIVAVLCCALFAGAALYVTLVEHPARMECGMEVAVTEFAPSYRRASVMQALLAIFGSFSATLVWFAGASITWLWGAILLFSVVPFTLLAILPTNRQLLDKSMDRQSDRARALMVRWGRLHAVRTIVSLASLVLFLKLIVIS
jgi:anthrone oxygenase-like protein